MHVLVIPSWYPSPENPIAGIFFRDAVKALSDRIDRVGVLYSNSHSLLRGIRLPRLAVTVDDGIPTYGRDTINILPKIPYGHSALYRDNGRRLFERYTTEQGRPDLIHAHASLYGGCLARTLAMRVGVPYIITEHSSDYARGILPEWKLRLARQAVLVVLLYGGLVLVLHQIEEAQALGYLPGGVAEHVAKRRIDQLVLPVLEDHHRIGAQLYQLPVGPLRRGRRAVGRGRSVCLGIVGHPVT